MILMARKLSPLKLLACVTLVYSGALTVMYMSMNTNTECGTHRNGLEVSDPNEDGAKSIHKHDAYKKVTFNPAQHWGPYTLAVIIPFRDRFEELMEFAPHLHTYLHKKRVRHKIFVVNQVDNLRFNRGSLINVGVLESGADCDYIAMHDVDLLPLNEELDYSYPASGPFHIAAPNLHPLYHYHSFIGGILLITKNDFKTVNGLSNRYWGWGREDDEFYVRLKKAGLLMTKFTEKNGESVAEYEIRRPKNITTGLKTFKHIHDKKRRPRDNRRYFNQSERTRRLDRETGLNTVSYDVVSRDELVINEAPVTLLGVKLNCDTQLTPWCLKPEDHYLLQQTPAPPK